MRTSNTLANTVTPTENGGVRVATGGWDMDDSGPLRRATEIGDMLIDLEYCSHLVVLLAVAVLNESDGVETTRTGAIRTVANRILSPENERARYMVENSLNALHSRGFIDRTRASKGNAYDWHIGCRGASLLGISTRDNLVRELAGTDITEDL